MIDFHKATEMVLKLALVLAVVTVLLDLAFWRVA